MRKLRLKEVKNQRRESSRPGTPVGRQHILREITGWWRKICHKEAAPGLMRESFILGMLPVG